MVKIICYQEANGIRSGVIYNNIHQNLFSINKKKKKIVKSLKAEKPPSVFILLIESLSRVNAHIQLPKTLNVLKEKYNATFLNGL